MGISRLVKKEARKGIKMRVEDNHFDRPCGEEARRRARSLKQTIVFRGRREFTAGSQGTELALTQ